MRSTIKTLVGTVAGISIVVVAALAIDSQYKTRFITSATLTINVKDGVYLTIRNFTQTGTATQRGAVIAGIFPTPPPTPTPAAAISTIAGAPVVIGSGTTMTDTAILSGGNNPTGTITFTLSNSSNATVDTEIVTVTGDNSYSTPTGFTPSTPDTYTWHATYSGDSNNASVTDNGQNESEVAVPAGSPTPTPTPVITPTPTPVPTPTPTPIFTTVLTAAISGASPAEFIKPVYVAGPAVLTIDPVSGATLAITYRKFVQPSGTPTPTPTATPIPTVTATGLTSSVTSAVDVSSASSQSVVATASGPSDDDDDSYSSTPAPTPSPTSTPSQTPSVTPTPSPMPTPSR
ncbi:MAG TPA: hypothetical protein VEH26_05660 [Chthoniobacterales bacterium]|nr:hypothetical protein [Chthoniobacterales bacterium]